MLRSRNDHLESLFDEASKQVKDLSSGGSYAKALEAFILEVRYRPETQHSVKSSGTNTSDPAYAT